MLANLDGKNILLRPLKLSDVNDRYVSWLNDPNVNQFLETRFQVQTIETVREFVSLKIKSSTEHLFAIIKKEGQQHIGNIKVGPINQHHSTADISLFIGEKAEHCKGYSKEAIALITQYSFIEKKIHKLKAGCYQSNIPSQKAFESNGYTREGELKEYFLRQGVRESLILYGLINKKI